MLSFKFWRQDFQASLVVFLVALPLCLGIALASNAPLSAGLFAGIIGGLVTGLISGSPISVSGPAAGLTVIVASSIGVLESFQTFTLAVFLSGVLQLIFGSFRLGKVGDFFPTSVIKGMLAAIGLILILKQLPHAVGYDVDYIGDQSFRQSDGQNTFTEILFALNWVHMGALVVSLTSLGIMLLWERLAAKGKMFFKLIPGALVAVLCSIILNELFRKFGLNLVIESKHLVQLPFSGGLKDLFAGMVLPNWSSLSDPRVYQVALTIAVVGSIETLLSVEAGDKLDQSGHVTSKNRELLAQGAGNVLSGLVGGLPLTAVIVRTSANFTAGARSNLSAFLHSGWILICVALIPSVLNLIPLASLASVLLLVGYKLTKPEIIKSMYQKGWNQFIPFLSTVLAILFTDLLVGIMIGMIVGFFFVLRSNMHKSIVSVTDGERVLIRFHKDVSFLQKSLLNQLLTDIRPGSQVIIDGSKGVFVDDDIIEMVVDFVKRAPSQDITVELKKSSLAINKLFKEVNNGQDQDVNFGKQGLGAEPA